LIVDPRTLIAEAQALGLFQPHGAFEVHCSHCHARLDSRGDCATCVLIGQTDPDGTSNLLRAAIEKRKNFKPVGAREGKSPER